MGYKPIEETKLYELSCSVANEIYASAEAWNRFAQNTVGLQLVRSVDSIAANLVEGDARFTDRDSVRFFNIGLASRREAQHWVKQSACRRIIDEETRDRWIGQLSEIGRMLSGLTAFRRKSQSSVVREDSMVYDWE